jgi:hypothetical protein
MSDEKEGNRINIEDLPTAESELTTEEAKDVKGGAAWHELVILGDVAAARKQTSPTDPAIDPATFKLKTSP